MHWVSPFPSSIDFHQWLIFYLNKFNFIILSMHCTFHTHSHFFAFGNYVACFRVSPIYPLVKTFKKLWQIILNYVQNVIFSPIPCALGKYQKEEDEQLINSANIRDVPDAKGTFVVDVGSLIAHAFNSEEYSNKIAEAEKGLLFNKFTYNINII